MIAVTINSTVCVHLWVSRHETVHVVVDLLKHEASVHEGEAALVEKRQANT